MRKTGLVLSFFAMFGASFAIKSAKAEKIRDVTRIKTDVPNELIGMGLVFGLKGTGDGGDSTATMQPLMQVLRRMDNSVATMNALKNANNVAIVMLSAKIPKQGAHSGDQIDVKVSSIIAKSLKGGQLMVVPLLAPRTDVKIVLGSASGELIVEDETQPTQAVIKGGAVLIEDILPEEIKGNQFTLVLDAKSASPEKASAIADQINEEVSPLTGGKAMAVAVDATSVQVNIPEAEQAHPMSFVAWVQSRSLPNLQEPAVVRINKLTNTITFTEGVELAPATICPPNMMTITVGLSGNSSPGMPRVGGLTPPPMTREEALRNGNVKLQDLVTAFNLMRVPDKDRVIIVRELYKANAIKAKLIEE